MLKYPHYKPTLYVKSERVFNDDVQGYETKLSFVPREKDYTDYHDSLVDLLEAGVSPVQTPTLFCDSFSALEHVSNVVSNIKTK